MVDERRASSRLAVPEWLGGEPGWYAVSALVMATLWFPFRLLLDRGEPIDEIVATSALFGAVWALIGTGIEWMGRQLRRERMRAGDSLRSGPEAPDLGVEAARRAWARRGAYIGLAVGVPYFGGLAVFCLVMGVGVAYATTFGIILLILATVAISNVLRNPERPRS